MAAGSGREAPVPAQKFFLHTEQMMNFDPNVWCKWGTKNKNKKIPQQANKSKCDSITITCLNSLGISYHK